MSEGHTIRPLEGIDEMKACVALQEETWGHGFSDRVPPALLKVGQMLGGVTAGAWNSEGKLDGFVFGITGIKDGEVVHWSDMLAVRRGLRDTGLGTRLKAYQRDVLLERGVRTMLWTFDPLRSRNAHVNFSKLGIVVREYVREMYGDTDSPLHHGIGTDRFVALWRMDSQRAARRVEGAERGPGIEAAEGVAVALDEADTSRPEAVDGAAEASAPAPPVAASLPHPGQPVVDLEDESVVVAIPVDISAMMAASMKLAVAWRDATRTVLTHYLQRGYEARELLRGPRISYYLFIKDASQ